LAAGAALLAAALGILAFHPLAGAAPGGAGTPQPVLGPADLDTTLMGAATEGAPGEVWGYRRLPLDVPPPIVDGQPLAFGPLPGGGPDQQLAFVRHTDATGWQVYETPLDENGQPYRGMLPNPLSARTTPHAGGLLVGRDPRRASGQQVVALLRQPGQRFQVLPAPPPAVLLPGEALADGDGSGRLAVSAFEENDRTGAFFAPVGLPVEDAVIHYDGQAFTREQVVRPAGSDASFQVLAIDATSLSNAWMLAKPADGLNRGVVLFERVVQAGTPRWVERDLGAPVFAARDTAGAGVSAVAPLGGSADPLTVTAGGVWIDAGLQAGDGADYTATLYFDPASGPGRVSGSWCDAPGAAGGPLCDHPLGARLSTKTGYRSFAWAGDGFGSRIITNALGSEGDEDANRGTYLSLQGATFSRMPGAGGNRRPSGAFASPTEGWLEGPVHITRSPEVGRLRKWPVSLRAPLASVAAEPLRPGGALGSQALAVGGDGGVARFLPGRGWTREFLLSASGSVARPMLRGVAWPEPGRAYAVGDLGTMWLWRADTGLWEKDPAAPIGGEANLMSVAFAPGDPQRGYAVGKDGTLLRYGKSWTQESLPPGVGSPDLTHVTFAGSQALVAAGRDLLVNDGGGWRVDGQVAALLGPYRQFGPGIFSVAGLPDGGAVAAGRDFVLERDRAGAPWRFADQPLVNTTVIAAAAVREGGRVRAVVSVVPRLQYPVPDIVSDQDPDQPPAIIPPFPLPGDGYVLRETQSGWHDEQHATFNGSTSDKPIKADPILSFDLDASGDGWAVGGWVGEPDSAGRGSGARNATGRADRQRVQTAGIYRYGASAGAAPVSTGGSPVGLPAGPARFALAGHAACETACADLSEQGIGPDRTLAGALAKVGSLASQPNGPRLLLYAGGRIKAGGALTAREADRYAGLLGGSSLPVFAAPSAADSAVAGAGPFKSAFAGFAAPFGSAGLPPGVDTTAIPGAAPGLGARTHYAFDSTGPGGRVRIVVIDNSAGSLAASDPHQNPAEPQLPWLSAVLADAKGRGIPTVVMGSRDLNTRILPSLNTASDGPQVARALVDGGASAYLFERPEENRTFRIPGGSSQTIPSFGTGTLGYRSPVSGSSSQADSLFGDAGFVLTEVDAAHRDPATNRAPVAARLIPVVDDVSLQAVDGVLLRRSRPSLFQGLGRRPIAGDRWGPASSDGTPNPPGGDPYLSFPPAQCVVAGCSSRLAPEYSFTSSNPDIGDFVRQDPQSTNLRKPFLDASDKVVSDGGSGLFCPFNAGTTTVTVRAGGLAYSQQVTVQAGSVQRPCGTRPLIAPAIRRARASQNPATPPPPAPAPAPTPTPGPVPPAPPAAPGAAVVPPTLKVPAPLKIKPPSVTPPVPLPLPLSTFVPVILPPPFPALGRPIPPGGAVARVYQVEEKKEEEAAPEETKAFSRYHPDDHRFPSAPLIMGALILLAAAGASLAGGRRGRARRVEAAVVTTRNARQSQPTYRRRRP